VHDEIVHLDLRTQLEHPLEERSGHLHLLGETPSHCPSEKPDLKFGLVWERNGNLLFLFLQMLLRDLLSLRALPQKCWCGGGHRGLEVCRSSMLMTVSRRGVVVAVSVPTRLVVGRSGPAWEDAPKCLRFPWRGRIGILHC
jgi:hypothetical protein